MIKSQSLRRRRRTRPWDVGAKMRRAEGGRRGGRDQRRLHGHYDAEGHRAAPREVGPSAAGGEVPPAAQAAVQEPLHIEDHPSE